MAKFLYGLCIGLILMAVVTLPSCGSSSNHSSVTADSSLEARVAALEKQVNDLGWDITRMQQYLEQYVRPHINAASPF